MNLLSRKENCIYPDTSINLHLIILPLAFVILFLGCSGCGSFKQKITNSTENSTSEYNNLHNHKKDSLNVKNDVEYQHLTRNEKEKHNLNTLKDYCIKFNLQTKNEEFYLHDKNQIEFGEHNNQIAIKVITNSPSEQLLSYYSFGLISEKGHISFNKLVIFNQKDGNVLKVKNIDEINPYLKSKDSKIEREIYFDFEQVSKFKIENPSERINNHDKIMKYWTSNAFNYLPDCNAYTLSFSKIGMSNKNEIIDVFSTIFILDSIGNLVFKSPEVNVNPGTISLSTDKKYCVVEFRNPETSGSWNGRITEEGFFVYDVFQKSLIYKYFLSDIDYREGKNWEGARYDNNSDLVFYSNTFPFSDDKANEVILVDLKSKTIYKKLFSKKEWADLSLIYYNQYNTWKKVLNYYTFSQENF